ncbi:MAG: metal ABC transporter permease [Nitrospiraceae bacterium]|nr:MAG: metal ABC transporter permease [Nitrospiraceae bacterium]
MTMISEYISYPFIQRALIASVMVGILCPFIGNFVVLRRMSFFSDAISHSAFAGIAVGALLGIDLSMSSILMAVIISFVIAFLSERTSLSHDTVIGVAFSGSIASGMLIMGMMKGYRADLFSYLFGDILAITQRDLYIILSVAILAIVTMLVFFKSFLQITFNRELARVEGINVRLFEYLLFFIIAIVVTVSLKIVGIILVTSLIIVPAAAAKNVASNMRQLFSFSSLFGVLSGIAGLAGSVYLDTASGPTIVMISIGIFILTLFRGRAV